MLPHISRNETVMVSIACPLLGLSHGVFVLECFLSSLPPAEPLVLAVAGRTLDVGSGNLFFFCAVVDIL